MGKTIGKQLKHFAFSVFLTLTLLTVRCLGGGAGVGGSLGEKAEEAPEACPAGRAGEGGWWRPSTCRPLVLQRRVTSALDSWLWGVGLLWWVGYIMPVSHPVELPHPQSWLKPNQTALCGYHHPFLNDT